MRQISCPVLSLALAAVILTAPAASAQYRRFTPSRPATGEVYHVEFGVGLFNPAPELKVASTDLGIIGTEIDGVADLGMAKHTIKDFRLVLRPAKKHRFRFGYMPIDYTGAATLTRAITFQGKTYNVGVDVASELRWKSWRFGYEWDFIYRDRGFVGVIFEGKYTNVGVDLKSAIRSGSFQAAAPVPTIGGIARIYAAANLAITGEITGFKLPGKASNEGKYDGKYLDYDVSATLNFSDNFGVQAGYRSILMEGRVDQDRARLRLKGPYIMGIARF